eukprot:2995474-Rhodomonas_salina.1
MAQRAVPEEGGSIWSGSALGEVGDKAVERVWPESMPGKTGRVSVRQGNAGCRGLVIERSILLAPPAQLHE